MSCLIGATKDGSLPGGYRHDRHEISVGEGEDVFARAGEALRSWHAQVGAGVEVIPAGVRVEEGQLARLAAPVARRVQLSVTRRYLSALVRAATAG